MDGSGDESSAGEESRVGTRIELVDCAQWRRADPREREDTVELIREFTGQPAGPRGARGRTLDEEEAHDLFDRVCEPDFAASFRLYKVYARAVAFGSHGGPERR